MNADLKLSLTHNTSDAETEFFESLVQHLWCKCDVAGIGRRYLVVDLKKIKGDEDDSGYVVDEGDHFNIVIENRLSFGARIGMLLHEISHCDCWNYTLLRDDHCESWGLSYSKMYRAYLKFYEEWCW